MSSSSHTQTSTRVNEALERYGAKTFGSLPRRIERLQRFTDIKNNGYAAEIRQENSVVWPALTITRETTPRYPLRSTTRAAENLLTLSRAIENGRVTTRRG